MKTRARLSNAWAAKDPSPRFLRFARALAFASGVAPFGCGGVTSSNPYGGGPMGVARPTDDAAVAGDAMGTDADASRPPEYDGHVLDVGPAPQPDAMADAPDAKDDGIVITPYDGGVLGVIITGIGPAPMPDAAAHAPSDASTIADARVDRIPVGGPQSAPALPAEWYAAEIG
jgi:hypothetical protein